MPRYIDAIEAEAAIKDLFADMPRIEFMGNWRRWREENEQYLRCLEVLRSLPTADVVEVVRCENCFWRNNCLYEQQLGLNVGLNGFCSYSERRTENMHRVIGTSPTEHLVRCKERREDAET